MATLRTLSLALFASLAFGQDPRSDALTTLDGYFPFEPPSSAEEWGERRPIVQRPQMRLITERAADVHTLAYLTYID